MQALPTAKAMDKEETPKPENLGNVGKRRIVRYDEIYDLRTNQTTLIKSAKSDINHRKGRNIVLVIRRIIDYKGRHVDTKVDIKSKAIATLLIEINQGVTGLTLTQTPPVAEPALFYHCQDVLQERFQQYQEQADTCGDFAIDLAVVMDFIQEEGGLLSNMNSLDHTPYWKFECTITADDGNSFGASREPLALEINEFDGTRKILDLLLFPLKYHPDADGIRAMALVRGKRNSAISGRHPMETSEPGMEERMGLTNDPL